ncbi:MAG: hypothetical protein JW782_02245 [Candidatus Saganbacteria bacterium]|nr:hypothetical protein [Candidatus Saganbacteria bacterium]
MKKIKKRGLRLLFLLLSCYLLGSTAFASLTLTLGDVRNQSNSVINSDTLLTGLRSGTFYLDIYHANPFGRDPRDTTNRLLIAADDAVYGDNSGLGAPPSYTLDYSKYLGYITSDNKLFFVRGASESAPGGTVYVRVWSGTPNAENSYYSRAASFANGALSPTSGMLNATTNYKAASPYPPVFTKFEETKTTFVDGSPATATLKIYATQPSPTDGIREVTGYGWRMGTASDTLADVRDASGTNLELASEDLEVGRTYFFQTVHRNWFGEAASAVQAYTVTGGVSEIGTAAFAFRKDPDGLGINTFPIPFTTISSASITNVKELAEYIIANNEPDNAVPAISTIGWWDDVNMQPVGYRIARTAGGDIVYTASAGVDADPAKETLSKDKVYQVSVTRTGVNLNLTGTR